MTDPVVCPQCREHLDIPAEFRGRPVRCGNCQTVFTPPPPPYAGRDIPTVPGRARRVADGPHFPDRPNDFDRPPPRKSNAGVLIVLGLTLLAFGGCCGGIIGITAIETNPTFTPYTSAEGQFKVEFPAPKPTAFAGTGDDKGEVVTASRPYNQEQYTVKCYDLKGEWRELSSEEALKEVAAAELKALAAGTETSREWTTHDGFTALDVLASSGAQLARRVTTLRCILVGPKVYVLAAQGQNTEPQFWWVRKFFVSFTLTNPPKPAKKEE